MLPPHRLIALALYFSAAYGRPASPPDENKPGDGQASKGRQLLKDPYNPHDLVSSEIRGRRPHLPYSARPSNFVGDAFAWVQSQNMEHTVSRILTYDGDPRTVFYRWLDCMRIEREKSGPGWSVWDYLAEVYTWEKLSRIGAMDDHCITTVNEEIQTEAAAKGKATYWAGRDTAAQYNPHLLESPRSPMRPPRLPHELLPAGDKRDRLSYIADENKKDILSKLKQYEGQHPTSWERFMDCVKKKADPYQMVVASYLTERLKPEHMLRTHYHEFACITTVNNQIDDEAGRQGKEAFLPVRTYAPLPQQARRRRPKGSRWSWARPGNQSPPQQEHVPRNEFSPASTTTWAGHVLTTQSHRLGLGARPLRKLVLEAHMMKMPTEVRALEGEFAH
ncbi:MAG: hypothetical protein M1826_006584 [Phylliscum demangeonii]|nr:MAG: hypothetical protein M1826_006584 [Phylliscum demangeonii]